LCIYSLIPVFYLPRAGSFFVPEPSAIQYLTENWWIFHSQPPASVSFLFRCGSLMRAFFSIFTVWLHAFKTRLSVHLLHDRFLALLGATFFPPLMQYCVLFSHFFSHRAFYSIVHDGFEFPPLPLLVSSNHGLLPKFWPGAVGIYFFTRDGDFILI